ncbi:MAG: hypothetical protein KGL39_00010 [Patescibacteria group bacterium]|nr:hypothetical protein [Patescibacteria group bacterium]
MPTGAPRPLKILDAGGWNTFTYYGGISGAFGVSGSAFQTSTSGTAGPKDIQLQSGPGRLDSILPIPPCLGGANVPVTFSGSTSPVIFYDAAAATSGGPFFLSGHRIVGLLPSYSFVNSVPTLQPLASGGVGMGQPPIGQSLILSAPFFSGLCVNLASGQLGFTANYSVEPTTSEQW